MRIYNSPCRDLIRKEKAKQKFWIFFRLRPKDWIMIRLRVLFLNRRKESNSESFAKWSLVKIRSHLGLYVLATIIFLTKKILHLTCSSKNEMLTFEFFVRKATLLISFFPFKILLCSLSLWSRTYSISSSRTTPMKIEMS